MAEWTVVSVIVVMAGLAAIIIPPIASLTKSITRLTVIVDRLAKDLDDVTIKNSESHRRLWEKNEEQGAALDDHEKRITIIETR